MDHLLRINFVPLLRAILVIQVDQSVWCVYVSGQ